MTDEQLESKTSKGKQNRNRNIDNDNENDNDNEDDKFQTEQVYDVEDEIQDWKFLNKSTIPKRGTKEFEPDGTNYQISALEQSQQTMFQAINNVRGHHTTKKLIGIWMIDEHDQYCFIPQIRGNYFKDLGKAINIGKFQGMKLNSLETIYLAERGSLIVYLGNQEYSDWLYNSAEVEENEDEDKNVLFDVESNLIALDLEYLYSLLTIPLANYQVYAYLKRLGYIIQEYKVQDDVMDKTLLSSSPTKDPKKLELLVQFTLWPREWGIMAYPLFHSLHFKTKHYFKYTDVFKNLKLNFKPIESDPNESNINITFNVWKPSPSFSKKTPPPPDFQLCVVDSSKNTDFLKLPQIQRLFFQLSPPPSQQQQQQQQKQNLFKKTKPSTKMESKRDIRARRYAERQAKLDKQLQLKNEYYRLRDDCFKNGGQSVIIAIVNNGIMNFISLSSGQFDSLQNVKTRLNEIYPTKIRSIIYNE